VPLVGFADGLGHLPSRLTRVRESRLTHWSLVVRDHVARDETPQALEHVLREWIGPLDRLGLVQQLARRAVVGPGEASIDGEYDERRIGGTHRAPDHGGVKPVGMCVTAALVLASVLAGCGSGSSDTKTTTAAAPATTRSSIPAGGPAPNELQGTWKLASKGPNKGLLFVISEQHYRVPTRLAHGDLAVGGDEIAFFNAAICGLTLPDGVGRYRWTVKGDALRFEPVGKEPCGGRADILANATYKRVG
jgi:hypothetical protein